MSGRCEALHLPIQQPNQAANGPGCASGLNFAFEWNFPHETPEGNHGLETRVSRQASQLPPVQAMSIQQPSEKLLKQPSRLARIFDASLESTEPDDFASCLFMPGRCDRVRARSQVDDAIPFVGGPRTAAW